LNDELKFITEKAKKSIVYYWDSFDNIPRYERTLSFFDVKYSFEPKDVTTYNLSLLTNFYYNSNRNLTPTNDIFFIGTFDERINIILQVLKSTDSHHKSAQIILQSDKDEIVTKYQSNSIRFIKKSISFEESEKSIMTLK